MKQIIKQISLITFIVLLGTLLVTAQVEGTIEKVWIEYNAKVKDDAGIKVHVKYSVRNAKGVDCSILVNVRRVDEGSFAFDRKTDPGPGNRGTTAFGASYNTYATKDGKAILMQWPFKSPYDRASYPNTAIFFPVYALQLRGGDPNKMIVTVTLRNQANEIARSVLEFGYGI